MSIDQFIWEEEIDREISGNFTNEKYEQLDFDKEEKTCKKISFRNLDHPEIIYGFEKDYEIW